MLEGSDWTYKKNGQLHHNTPHPEDFSLKQDFFKPIFFRGCKSSVLNVIYGIQLQIISLAERKENSM